jgi:hypothetical protein
MNSLKNEAIKCEQALLLLSVGIPADAPEQNALAVHLKGCVNCQREEIHYRQLHLQLAALPVPEPDEPQMQADFQSMLAAYGREQRKAAPSPLAIVRQWFEGLWGSPLTGQLAFGAGMLLIGWALGYWFMPGKSDSDGTKALANQVEAERGNMVLALITQPAATDRLKAVSYTGSLQQADDRVVKALLYTLNHDENVNVRLVTVEALYRFADNQAVREGLVKSIAGQESPLVQIALADAMVGLQEKRSVEKMRELLRHTETDAMVKEKLESSIQVLL